MKRLLYFVALLFALCRSATGTDLIEPVITPECPSISESVEILAYSLGPMLAASPYEVSVVSTRIKFVATASTVDFGPNPFTWATARLGPLLAGTYHVDFYLRYSPDVGQYGPEVYSTSAEFTVSDNPPACTPAKLDIASGQSLVLMPVGTNIPYSMLFAMTDPLGRPVANQQITIQAMPAPPTFGLELPNSAGFIIRGPSDARGIVQVSIIGSAAPATTRYMATLQRGPYRLTRTFTVSTLHKFPSAPVVPVVEYYNGLLRHYFITSDSAEIALLDARKFSNWESTGYNFLAYAPDSLLGNAVCRFYGRPEAGLDSHFYSASTAECDDVERRFGAAWIKETPDLFKIGLPDSVTGACPAGTQPIYRLFNNAPDTNHRYTASIAIRDLWRTFGWIPEGYGPDAVAMCAPN